MNEWKIKQEMCEIGQRIWQRGYCAGNEGNHSVRISDDRVLCTPTGISKGMLTPEMICTVDYDGNQVSNNGPYKRTSEVLVHLAIFKKRPDVNAVIHSHPAHATAFAVSGMPIPEGIHPEAEVFLGRVPMAPYSTPGKPELSASLLPLIKEDTNSIMMGNHGSVHFADTLVDAYYKLEILDNYCRILLLSQQLGRVSPLTREQMDDLLKVKQLFGMQDARGNCAIDGCVGGAQNKAFLDTMQTPLYSQSDTAANSTSADLEDQVQAITNQIMQSLNR